ncbi:MAG: hypothetical protein JST68_13005, partial [Bacteroidetes bacterium]|nr:hypothetical protein [Bacteroidota bacterium]
SAKPESDNFKWFYGDVWAMAFDKKLVFDLYADYERLNWTSTWHHSRQMTKGYIAYNTPALTIGVEGYINVMKNDNIATKLAPPDAAHLNDTLTSNAKGISAYVHGDIVKNKLRYFVRYDNTKPNSKVDVTKYKSYANPAGNFDYNNKEQFFVAGLDFTPVRNVHFMPNIYINNYKSELASATDGSKLKSDNDVLYRLTFYFVFGK